MGDQIKRFEQWRRSLRGNSSSLVKSVIDEVVPQFLAHGYGRFTDYAGDNDLAVGGNCIPLQRRCGEYWPTIEISFNRSGRPILGLTFACLPEICQRRLGATPKAIPRIEANVVEGPTSFLLCKGRRQNYDCNFGYRWFSFRPRHKIQEEVFILRSRTAWLIGVLENGIPQDWLVSGPGYVHDYVVRLRMPQ